jgi:outer membrane protein insertion porin family
MKHSFVVAAAVAVALLGAAGAAAQQLRAVPPGPAIGRVEVTGNHFVSRQNIMQIFGVREGDELREDRISEAIRRLVQTKNFADIVISTRTAGDSLIVVVAVKEYPRVKEIRVTGTDKIKRADVEAKIQLREGYFARPALFSQDVAAIKALYAEKGYNSAAVEVKKLMISDEHNVIVAYAITEGQKIKIRHIDFLGVGAIESAEIRKIIETKESRWWRGGELKPVTLEEDLKRIKELYGTRGYLDAEARVARQEIVGGGKHLDLYIEVDEGPQYLLGNLAWSGNKLVTDEEIETFVDIEKGDPFATDQIEFLQYNISGKYWEQGYIYSRVIPSRRVRNRRIDLSLRIEEGNPASINEIKITGNTKTFETVIRRELKTYPGDRFILTNVQRSLREVVALGYFNGPPKVNTEQANEAGDINLLIGVEEKQTGNFRFGAGFSQLNSLSGFFGIQENNLLGRGKGVSLDWEFGKYRQSFNFQYTEPYFRNTRNTVSLSLYNWIQDRVRQQYYNDRRKGFSVALGRPFPWLDYTRLYTSYRLEEVELSNFSSLYPEIGALRGVDWPQIKSAVLVSLTRNSTDNPSHPTKGSVNSLSAEFCGGVLQGNVNYMRYIAETSWFRTLFWKFTFHMNMELGAIDGFTGPDQVQDFEKFRLGGNRRYALRGYDFYEVVPEGNDAYVGGRFMASFTHEILFPFTDAVYGLFFFDAGNTWNSFGSADLFNLRRGLGLGVRLEMPGLGNLGFDYGYGYDKVGGPAWEPHFTFGTMF